MYNLCQHLEIDPMLPQQKTPPGFFSPFGVLCVIASKIIFICTYFQGFLLLS